MAVQARVETSGQVLSVDCVHACKALTTGLPPFAGLALQPKRKVPCIIIYIYMFSWYV